MIKSPNSTAKLKISSVVAAVPSFNLTIIFFIATELTPSSSSTILFKAKRILFFSFQKYFQQYMTFLAFFAIEKFEVLRP